MSLYGSKNIYEFLKNSKFDSVKEEHEENLEGSMYPWDPEEGSEKAKPVDERKVTTASLDYMIKQSYIKYIKDHKDSKGGVAPYCIVSHETGKVLSSHKTREDAKEHLQDMHTHSSESDTKNVFSELKTMRQKVDYAFNIVERSIIDEQGIYALNILKNLIDPLLD